MTDPSRSSLPQVVGLPESPRLRRPHQHGRDAPGPGTVGTQGKTCLQLPARGQVRGLRPAGVLFVAENGEWRCSACPLSTVQRPVLMSTYYCKISDRSEDGKSREICFTRKLWQRAISRILVLKVRPKKIWEDMIKTKTQ